MLGKVGGNEAKYLGDDLAGLFAGKAQVKTMTGFRGLRRVR